MCWTFGLIETVVFRKSSGASTACVTETAGSPSSRATCEPNVVHTCQLATGEGKTTSRSVHAGVDAPGLFPKHHGLDNPNSSTSDSLENHTEHKSPGIKPTSL